eukprot:5284048-Heterocapsa_arctica.AAC.1
MSYDVTYTWCPAPCALETREQELLRTRLVCEMMKMIYFTGKEMQIDDMIVDNKYIGMINREAMDWFLRDRAKNSSANLINVFFNDISDFENNARKGVKNMLKGSMLIDAD